MHCMATPLLRVLVHLRLGSTQLLVTAVAWRLGCMAMPHSRTKANFLEAVMLQRTVGIALLAKMLICPLPQVSRQGSLLLLMVVVACLAARMAMPHWRSHILANFLEMASCRCAHCLDTQP